jgi:hypothetical protein
VQEEGWVCLNRPLGSSNSLMAVYKHRISTALFYPSCLSDPIATVQDGYIAYV